MRYYCKNCKSEFTPGNEKLSLPPVNNPSVHCPFCKKTDCEFGIIPDGIFEEISAERRRQDEKFGEQNYPMVQKNFNFDIQNCLLKKIRLENKINGERGKGCWFDILFEKMLEAFVETEPEKQREEMVQVAAVAVAIIEYLDRRIV
jgi:hypothetical protein